MRVLVVGAYGFIGSAIAHELISRGHRVTGLGRDTKLGRRTLPQVNWITADLSELTRIERWRHFVGSTDAVVNASGLLQSGEGGSVETVQLHAVSALVKACEAAGVGRLVQVSAAGAVADAESDFMVTKARADSIIGGSAVRSIVLRPGLVIGRNSFGGTEVVRAAAALPVKLRFPFNATVQCTALSDLVTAVADALQPGNELTGAFDLVERQRRSLDSIIATHRQWLGLPMPRCSISVPRWLLRGMSRAADAFGRLGWRSPLRRNGLLALEAGVEGDVEQSIALLRREPVSLEATLAELPAGKQDRLYARLTFLQPLLIASIAVMWVGSGAATLLQIDDATAVLERDGIGATTARAIAFVGGWADVALAAALLWRRTARPALLAMIVLTIFVYLVGGTLLVPRLWIDPLAPLAKALPATVLALIAYWLLERR